MGFTPSIRKQLFTWFAYLGLVGLLGTLHPALEPLQIFAFCGVIYLVLVVASWLRAAVSVDGGPPGEHVLVGRMRIAHVPEYVGSSTTGNP